MDAGSTGGQQLHEAGVRSGYGMQVLETCVHSLGCWCPVWMDTRGSTTSSGASVDLHARARDLLATAKPGIAQGARSEKAAGKHT